MSVDVAIDHAGLSSWSRVDTAISVVTHCDIRSHRSVNEDRVPILTGTVELSGLLHSIFIPDQQLGKATVSNKDLNDAPLTAGHLGLPAFASYTLFFDQPPTLSKDLYMLPMIRKDFSENFHALDGLAYDGLIVETSTEIAGMYERKGTFRYQPHRTLEGNWVQEAIAKRTIISII